MRLASSTSLRPTIVAAALLAAGSVLGIAAALGADAAAAPPKVDLVGRAVPDPAQLPPGPQRDLVRYGEALTARTFAIIGPEVADPKMRHAGNNLACTSCHQAGATKPFAMPWVGVSASFPQYRAREDDVSTVEERVNGCMQRSMNGRTLALDSREMKAYVAYIAFLSTGVPVGAPISGAGTLQSKVPNRRADVAAGAQVYAAKCAACHGAEGQGQRVGKVGDAQGYAFPPLWGPDSFNNGAGMNRMLMATRFIRHNMPLGASHAAGQLDDDEAYDVAAYMLSQPRPVKANLEADFPARWNKPIDAAFPPYVLGFPPEQHRFGPFPPMAEKARQVAAQRAAAAASQAAAK
ncbi:MAG: c-type cytochrome [Proteobacteria bacterium]|nr:c-type cytochrome [Pseudomonadota bacterium]